MKKLLFLFLLPGVVKAQSRKDEFNIYREIGLTVNSNAYGLHYSWQAQISKNLYLGMGAEAMRITLNDKETVRTEKVIPATFRLSYMSNLHGLCLVPYVGTGVVLTQPTGTLLEGGLGLAAGKWQLSAVYRSYNTGREQPSVNSGIFLRLSKLLITEATKPRFE